MPHDLVFRREKGRGVFVDPMGWLVSGVISPLEHGFFARPQGLICSPSGLLAVTRSYRGFFAAGVSAGFGYSPTYSADDITMLSSEMRELAATFARHDIRSITLLRRWGKNEIRIGLTAGSAERFFIFARAATPDYAKLLHETFPHLYEEQGFDDTLLGRLKA